MRRGHVSHVFRHRAKSRVAKTDCRGGNEVRFARAASPRRRSSVIGFSDPDYRIFPFPLPFPHRYIPFDATVLKEKNDGGI
jgi:hypothetical protein